MAMDFTLASKERQWELRLVYEEKIYEPKSEGQERGMALGLRVTHNMFDFGHVALELPMGQPQPAQGMMLVTRSEMKSQGNTERKRLMSTNWSRKVLRRK